MIYNLPRARYKCLSPNEKLDLKMYKKHNAVPFTKHLYIANRDPPLLQHENRLGRAVYVRRGRERNHVPNDSQRVLNLIQADDPGVKLLFTVFELGFGDCYYIGCGVNQDVQAALYGISQLQSELSKLIDLIPTVISARSDLEERENAQFDHPEIMLDKEMYDIAAKGIVDAKGTLAKVLKQQHDPLWHMNNNSLDPSSDGIVTLIKKIDGFQTGMNRKVKALRQNAVRFMSAREVTLKSTFNMSSPSKSDKISGRAKTVGLMFGHGRITSHDLPHANQLRGTCTVRVTEPFSTATCATCGNCIRNQGRSRVYHCSNPECRAKHGRDENGARANAIIKIAAMFD